MNGDLKFILAFVFICIGLPMMGLAASEYQQHTCKIELAKAGRTAADIKTICK